MTCTTLGGIVACRRIKLFEEHCLTRASRMSGLEPLAALGLVCNVLQLVKPLNLEDARLLTLARNCRDAEAEWRKKTPSRFLSQQQPRKRDRLGAAFRGVINKPEIDRLEGQLQKAKESLEADLLVGVFKRLDISKVQTDDLQVKLQTLLQATSVSETKLHDLIQSQVTLINSQLSGHILRAEASTKAHVTTELARHESRLKSHADQGKGTILTEAEVRENSRRENEVYERLLRSFQYPDMNHRIHKRLTKTPKKLYELYLDMWNRLGEDSNIYQRSTALIFKIVILVWQSSRSRIAGRALATWAPLISILELMVASSDDLWATPINHFDRLCTTDLEQRCEELWTRIPTRTAGFFEVTHTTILERLPELLWAYKSGVPVLRYDKMKVQAIHRTVFDFLIETEGGKKIMEHHTASQEELFIRVFRSCLFRDCLWPEHYFKVTPNGEVINKGSHRWFESGYRLDIHLKSLSTYGYLIQGSVLTEMLDILWNSLVEVNKKLPLHPDSTVNSRVPRCKLDFLLRIAPMGFDAYIRKHIIEWRNKQQFDVLY
ncbi:hypothetical protein FOC1_g10002057 [Fusarium oxysporum f. sp. cubense race 1]|uniref:DUF7791 domain-containing protein n=1 Tax=Fusarium oxysporum f. sp. cubense (strain race 1) TaxID=1229664 RepID=N4U7I5_FUSC1|nr:hypothetical protein FOC1_g10002057 [Fusarium oxysporum f. sp. cubense race 1]